MKINLNTSFVGQPNFHERKARKTSIRPKIHEARESSIKDWSGLTARVNALISKANDIPAYVKHTALVVAGLAAASFIAYKLGAFSASSPLKESAATASAQLIPNPEILRPVEQTSVELPVQNPPSINPDQGVATTFDEIRTAASTGMKTMTVAVTLFNAVRQGCGTAAWKGITALVWAGSSWLAYNGIQGLFKKKAVDQDPLSLSSFYHAPVRSMQFIAIRYVNGIITNQINQISEQLASPIYNLAHYFGFFPDWMELVKEKEEHADWAIVPYQEYPRANSWIQQLLNLLRRWKSSRI